jgi:hypothetical protein
MNTYAVGGVGLGGSIISVLEVEVSKAAPVDSVEADSVEEGSVAVVVASVVAAGASGQQSCSAA